MADSTTIYEKVGDYQVYWTASFYMAGARIPKPVLTVLKDPARLGEAQAGHPASVELANAMNPLFNDIADRERAGRIEDFLFACGDPEWIDLDMPGEVSWTTEGVVTTASPPDHPGPQKIRVRRFWYVYRDGSASWHVSFRLDYGPKEGTPEWDELRKLQFDRSIGLDREDRWHTPGLLYFLSRLQKVLAPKEFALDPALAGKGGTAKPLVRVWKTGDVRTGIGPVDDTLVRLSTEDAPVSPLAAGADGVESFWQRIALWFAADSDAFFERVRPGWKSQMKDGAAERLKRIEADPMEELVGCEPMLEVPGLALPRFRYMFFFVDRTFFDRLMPPLDEDGRRIEPRARYVNATCYLPFLEENQKRTVNGRLPLDASYWKWVEERPDLEQTERAVRRRLAETAAPGEDADKRFDDWLAEYRKARPAWKGDNRPDRPDCLDYMFLSGFNQNIIDFMAQDASEVLDSLDPIYPDSEDDSAERFFVRYATPRAFHTYVSSSRSLESGNDYIGTCPYAFLIHVLALHNEYLARDYEKNTEPMIARIKALNETNSTSEAIRLFHAFRIGAFSDYARNRYGKVFRYDTESTVFERLEQARGIARKTEYLDVIVEHLEKQTADLQARLQKREEREVAYAVGAVGAFGLFSLAFDIFGSLGETSAKTGAARWNVPDWLYSTVLALSVGVSLFIVGYLVRVLVRDAAERLSEMASEAAAAKAASAEWETALDGQSARPGGKRRT